MDDSDEYFDDSFMLDDDALASIQATEECFGASLSQRHPTCSLPAQPGRQASTGSPPSKKLKRSHGSVGPVAAGIIQNSAPLGLESSDLNPEIRVGPDGSYVVGYQSTVLKHAAINFGNTNVPVVRSGLCSHTSELASLRTQLAELYAANAAIQQALREAQDAQLVKAGEVSILRQTIDKTKKEHAEAISKAKANMIAHEKVKAELQTKLKEETERMATRLVFQQQEMETSTRKPTWGSVRSHRRHEGVKQPQFKGFHNAFTNSAHVIAQSPAGDKQGRIDETQGSDPFLTPMKKNGNDSWHASPLALRDEKGKGTNVDGEFQFDWEEEGGPGEEILVVDQEGNESSSLPVDRLNIQATIMEQRVDWGEELRRIVFTHVSPRHDALTTLHILLSTTFPPETSVMDKHAYTTACEIILETCGAKHACIQDSDDPKWEVHVIHKVANAFVIVGDILDRTGCISPLTALLDLLLLITLYIPAFVSPFLGPSVASHVVGHLDPDKPPQLLSMLCHIVQSHLVPPKPNLNDTCNMNGNDKTRAIRATLAMAVVQLMESLCWNVKDDLVNQLSMPFHPQVFNILLDPAQSPELIARTLQLLVLLATQRGVVQCLVTSYPSDTVNSQTSPFVGESAQFWLVDRLCGYLVDPTVEEPYRIRYLVITLFSLLIESQIEARTILLDSASLVPSLVICITKLSRLLWEDDITVMNNPTLAKLTVDVLCSSVNLLHHLVFVLDMSAVLGRKLVEASRLPGTFNGATHMFIVTFGRLSWADGPDWLDKECQERCEIIADYAMEIIETVVAGPECDSLWAVWHQSEATDEEELEAWRIQMD